MPIMRTRTRSLDWRYIVLGLGLLVAFGGLHGQEPQKKEKEDHFNAQFTKCEERLPEWGKGAKRAIEQNTDSPGTEHVFVAGGYDLRGNYSNRIDFYDTATRTFVPAGFMLTKRIEYGAALLKNGKILMAGGSVVHEINDAGIPDAELYDPRGEISIATAHPLNVARAGLTATRLRNGKVLLAGGNDAFGAPLASAEIYDPATDTFRMTAGKMSVPRFAHTATLLSDGHVLLAGGFQQVSASGIVTSNTADVYDPETDTFKATSTMSMARAYHTATLLLSGRVLVAGGATVAAPTNTADIFDPESMKFTPTTGSMTDFRAGHAAALLQSGEVLLTSGIDAFNQDGTSGFAITAEIYDPTTGTFRRTTENMVQTRAGHSSTTLLDGKVLLAGGGTGNGSIISDTAEIYDPCTDKFSATGVMTTTRGLVPAIPVETMELGFHF
jgi:Galactose oxidase, central domain/Kelch motif